MELNQCCYSRGAARGWSPRSPASSPRRDSVANEAACIPGLRPPKGTSGHLEELLLEMDDRQTRHISDLKVSLQHLLANHHRDLECAFVAAGLGLDPLSDSALSKQTRLPLPPLEQAPRLIAPQAKPTCMSPRTRDEPTDNEANFQMLQSANMRNNSQLTPHTASSDQIGRQSEHLPAKGMQRNRSPGEKITETVERDLTIGSKAVDHEFSKMVDPETNLDNQDVEAEGRIQKCLLAVTESRVFQAGVATAIFVNSVLLGVIVHLDIMLAFRGEDVLDWESTVEVVFMIIFTAEVALRIAAERCIFFNGNHWKWNVFDFVVVMTTLLEYMAAGLNVGALRVLRVLRMLRVMRVMRLMRFLRELRMMVCAILCSGASLFWAAMLMLLSVYLFSVFLGEVMRTHLREVVVDDADHAVLMTYYDGLLRTMLQLVIALMGGNDWYDVAEPVMKLGPAYGISFILFVCFVTLGMLNVLTGIFVESASNISGMDSELVMAMELKEKDSRLAGLKRLFKELTNDDKSMTLTWTELIVHLENERVQMHFEELEITAFHATRLFQLLDTDGSQSVGIDEFIDGCMRFRGVAKAVDLASIIFDAQRQNLRFEKKMGDINDATAAQGEMLKSLCVTFQRMGLERRD